MKDSTLKFDRRCHVIYSPACGKSIRRAIALHYPPEERENVWERVQLRYVEFLGKMRTDLGGRKNFHNGRGGTYDCVALTAYYDVCRKVSSIEEIEKMTCALILPAFRRLRFVNCNNPFMKKLMYRAFLNAKKQCDRWGDYKMNLEPFSPDKPIRYEFTECPVAEFAKKAGLSEIMPTFCNPDFEAMELIHAKLVRTTTCANGARCDYAICGDRDGYAKVHPEYVDENGYRRND